MNRRTTRETEMLLKARHSHNLSQLQVATLIGFHVRQYQRFEYGGTDIAGSDSGQGLPRALCPGLIPWIRRLMATGMD